MDPAVLDSLIKRQRRARRLVDETSLSRREAEIVVRRERPYKQPDWRIAADFKTDVASIRDEYWRAKDKIGESNPSYDRTLLV